MWFLHQSAGLRIIGRTSVVFFTFSSPMTMKLVFWKLEVDNGACAKHIGIHFFVIRKRMDLFTKWDSSCDPACLVLTLRRQLSCTSYALVLVSVIASRLAMLDSLLHRRRENPSCRLGNVAESDS